MAPLSGLEGQSGGADTADKAARQQTVAVLSEVPPAGRVLTGTAAVSDTRAWCTSERGTTEDRGQWSCVPAAVSGERPLAQQSDTRARGACCSAAAGTRARDAAAVSRTTTRPSHGPLETGAVPALQAACEREGGRKRLGIRGRILQR